MSSSKRKVEKERKTYLRKSEKLQNKIRGLKNKLLGYKILVHIRKRIRDIENVLSVGFNEESYDYQMQEKITGQSQCRWILKEKNSHYRRWQYIINIAEESDTDDRISKFRALFGGESNLLDSHMFCMSIRNVCKLISFKAFRSKKSIFNKRQYNESDIRKNLETFTNLYPFVINNIMRVMKINNDVY